MVHIHKRILLPQKRNAFESVMMRWMNLEPIIQSEVSKKEKDKYHKSLQMVIAAMKLKDAYSLEGKL